MTLTELQKEVDTLSATDQEKLAAYLAFRQKERDEEWNKTISRRLNDNDPKHWVALEDL